MHRLALFLVLAALPAAAHAQPSLAGVPHTAPAGYTAARELGDSATAVFRSEHGNTAVFVAALARVEDRAALVTRMRGALAAATSPRNPGTYAWRLLASEPVSPFDVYHERWVGWDGKKTGVIASLHHLRQDGRDLLVGSAFFADDGGFANEYNHGISSTWSYPASEALARLVAELVGDPPFDEQEIGPGSPLASRQQAHARVETPEQAAVRAAFEAYRAGLLARDGEASLPHVAQAVFEYYGEVQRLALYATAEEVRARPLSDQMFVLLLRRRVSVERLRAMTPRELFAHGVEGGWIGEQSTCGMQLGRVMVFGNLATARAGADGDARPTDLAFVRQDGAWKWDMLGVVQRMDPVLRTLAERNGLTPEELVTRLVEGVAGKLPTDVWDPPFPRP